MYLDTPERRRVENAVANFHRQWFPQAKDRINKSEGNKLFFLIGCYVAALTAVILLLPPDMAGWFIMITVLIFIGLMWLSCRRHQKKIAALAAGNQPQKWMEEIEELRVGYEERQLFLRLISAMNRGKGVRDLSLEAVHSADLCRLAFVWKVYDYALSSYLASR